MMIGQPNRWSAFTDDELAEMKVAVGRHLNDEALSVLDRGLDEAEAQWGLPREVDEVLISELIAEIKRREGEA